MLSSKILQISLENTYVGVSLSLFNISKKQIQQRCFPVKCAKFLRTPITKNIVETM